MYVHPCSSLMDPHLEWIEGFKKMSKRLDMPLKLSIFFKIACSVELAI